MKKVLLVLIVFIGLFTLSGCPASYMEYEILAVDRFEYDNESFEYTLEENYISNKKGNFFKCYDTYEEFHKVFKGKQFKKYSEEYFENKSVLTFNIIEKYKYYYYKQYRDGENAGTADRDFLILRKLKSEEEVNKKVVLIITMGQKFSDVFENECRISLFLK